MKGLLPPPGRIQWENLTVHLRPTMIASGTSRNHVAQNGERQKFWAAQQHRPAVFEWVGKDAALP
jgi:hypothetical protein